MPLAEAQALVGLPETKEASQPPQGFSANGVLFLKHDPRADLQKLEELRQLCLQFSPVVVVAPGPLPDALLFDMTGCERLYGSEEKMVRKIGGAFARWGYSCRVVLSDTPLAAQAIARLAQFPGFRLPAGLVSSGRLTSSLRRCSGAADVEWLIVSPGHLQQITRYLPVELLELPGDVIEQLKTLGIRTVHQLICLPRTSLQERFGTLLLQRLDFLLGLKDEELVIPDEPLQINEIWQFDIPTDNSDLIEYVIDHLLRLVARKLRDNHMGTLHLVVTLYFEVLEPKEIHVSIFHPTCSYDHLRDLVQLQLHNTSLSERVTGVRVEALDLAPLAVRQRSLFPSLFPDEDSSPFSVLAERLANRLGSNSVLLVEELPDPIPEHAVRYTPVGTARPSPRRSKTPGESAVSTSLPPRPLRVFRRPEPIRIERTTLHGFPATFHWRGRRWQAHRYSETERIEGGWWRTKNIRRDYFQLECSQGTLLWVFRDANTAEWFVHGIFE